MHTHAMPERYNTEGGQLLEHDQLVVVTGAESWMPAPLESWKRLGIGAPVQAIIQAAEKKFYAFRTPGELPGGLGADPQLKGADFLLADESPYKGRWPGIMAIRASEDWTTLGRLHNYDVFEYPDTMSGSHFRVKCDAMGNLHVHNLRPLNKTWLYRKLAAPALSAAMTEDRATAEVRRHKPIMYAVAERARRGEDRSLIAPQWGLFGVFDGVGSSNGGGQAAQTAADTVHWVYSSAPPESGVVRQADDLRQELKYALQTASNMVTKRHPGGATTGVVARIVRDAMGDGYQGPHVVWAAAGDSRIYVLQYPQLLRPSVDEGFGSVLVNCLGCGGTVTQSGVVALWPGDKILLVTDGITGNEGKDVLHDKEIIAACTGYDVRVAAKNLLRRSRKRDDKTALVIEA